MYKNNNLILKLFFQLKEKFNNLKNLSVIKTKIRFLTGISSSESSSDLSLSDAVGFGAGGSSSESESDAAPFSGDFDSTAVFGSSASESSEAESDFSSL